jgi:adenylyltransferase/sulfurtransferase
LAGAGVRRIGIIDDDIVSESNLNWQFLFTTADLGREKALSAAERLSALNL